MKRVDGSLERSPFPGDPDDDQPIATERRATSAASRSRERLGEAKAYPRDTSSLDRSLTWPEEPAGRLASCIIRARGASAHAGSTWSRLSCAWRAPIPGRPAQRDQGLGSASWSSYWTDSVPESICCRLWSFRISACWAMISSGATPLRRSREHGGSVQCQRSQNGSSVSRLWNGCRRRSSSIGCFRSPAPRAGSR